jgi:hypothetical protein
VRRNQSRSRISHPFFGLGVLFYTPGRIIWLVRILWKMKHVKVKVQY